MSLKKTNHPLQTKQVILHQRHQNHLLQQNHPPQDLEPTFDKRRLEEKFATIGDPLYPIPPGLQFDKLPEDWSCPTCGAAKTFFESKSVEIAGFAQNQQYGLGGNSLTSGQKAILIYGSLLFFFVLFLSGYFLQ
ncbi:hypothetical protein P3X46_005463 [Hevea brasiliensis]|uniref:Rubredoxin-like domain-containing protein n=1 Tax=Hevea brasiliensis TaxID=3981 RepID=A0ABQ9N0S0_HEVBR|nr:hypothetical protein P3X46_005463 [Hevea brasiliensis]